MAHKVDKKEDPWILLVDDDPDFSRILEAFLKRLGVRLVCTQSVEEFTKVIKEKVPALCLVDLKLHGLMAGFALIKALRKKFGAKLPMMIISATDDQAAISTGIECGADDYIVKPFDPSILSVKIERYMGLGNSTTKEIEYVEAPAGGMEAKMGFELKVKSMDELGVNVLVPHFMGKGTPVILNGAIIEQAFPKREKVLSSVLSCESLAEGGYLVYLEFAELQSHDQADLRAFISNVYNGKNSTFSVRREKKPLLSVSARGK